MIKNIFLLGITVFLFLSDLSGKTEPDFLILGVTKCGTTTLYRWMVQHPDIYDRHKKELHFFDRPEIYKKGLKWYRQQFLDEKVSGEASPGYFWKKECLERIHKFCPNSKLIVICRNPIKRAISAYFMHKRNGDEKRSFEKAVLGDKANFERYIGAGMYAKNLASWLKYFSKNQIHIMFLEELSANPKDELNKVFRFLGLKEYQLKSYDFEPRSKYDMSEIKPESIKYLESFYKPHNEAFAKLLGRKLPW